MNNNDIEEDIKILEELREYFIFNTSGFLDRTREEQKRTAYAINNILAEYKRYKNMYEAEHRIHLVRNEQLERKEIAVQKANKYDRLVDRINNRLEYTENLLKETARGILQEYTPSELIFMVKIYKELIEEE